MRCKIDEKEDNPGEYVMEEGEKMNLGVNEKDRKTSMLRRVEVVIKGIFQAMLPRKVVRKMLYSLNWHCLLRQSEIKDFINVEIYEKDKVKEADPVEENTDDTNKQILNEEILI